MCHIINNNDDKIIDKSILKSFIDIIIAFPLAYLSKKIIGTERKTISSPNPEKKNWKSIHNNNSILSARFIPNNASISENIRLIPQNISIYLKTILNFIKVN